MNSKNFLSYTSSRREILDNWIQNAIALKLNLDKKIDELDDNFEVSYSIEMSMREWEIVIPSKDRVDRSQWSFHDVGSGLVIDSAMRDQHVVSLQLDSSYHNLFRVALSPPQEIKRPTLFSLKGFNLESLDVINRVIKEGVISQIRWLRLPRTQCEGIFFSNTKEYRIFIPLVTNEISKTDFTNGNYYSTKYVFEYAKERLLQINN